MLVSGSRNWGTRGSQVLLNVIQLFRVNWDSNSHHLATEFAFLTTVPCCLSVSPPWKHGSPPPCLQVTGHFYGNGTKGT